MTPRIVLAGEAIVWYHPLGGRKNTDFELSLVIMNLWSMGESDQRCRQTARYLNSYGEEEVRVGD